MKRNWLKYCRRFSCYGSEESTCSSWLMQAATAATGYTPTASYDSWISSQCSTGSSIGGGGSCLGRSDSQTSSQMGTEPSAGTSSATTEGAAQDWRRGRSRTRNACAANDSNGEISRLVQSRKKLFQDQTYR